MGRAQRKFRRKGVLTPTMRTNAARKAEILAAWKRSDRKALEALGASQDELLTACIDGLMIGAGESSLPELHDLFGVTHDKTK